jgi:hypothetical protein
MTALSTSALSAVALGRLFETATQRRLALLGASLTRSGGAFDQCVDLHGSWALPFPRAAAPHPEDRIALGCLLRGGAAALQLPLVVQCKATAGPAGVAVMRELQHAVAARFPRGTLSVLACTGGFALGALMKERTWLLRDCLLLHLTPGGGVVAAALMRPPGGAEADELQVDFTCAPRRAVLVESGAPLY